MFFLVCLYFLGFLENLILLITVLTEILDGSQKIFWFQNWAASSLSLIVAAILNTFSILYYTAAYIPNRVASPSWSKWQEAMCRARRSQRHTAACSIPLIFLWSLSSIGPFHCSKTNTKINDFIHVYTPIRHTIMTTCLILCGFSISSQNGPDPLWHGLH